MSLIAQTSALMRTTPLHKFSGSDRAIIIALITVFGTIVVAFIYYFSMQNAVVIQINGTQTAEAKVSATVVQLVAQNAVVTGTLSNTISSTSPISPTTPSFTSAVTSTPIRSPTVLPTSTLTPTVYAQSQTATALPTAIAIPVPTTTVTNTNLSTPVPTSVMTVTQFNQGCDAATTSIISMANEAQAHYMVDQSVGSTLNFWVPWGDEAQKAQTEADKILDLLAANHGVMTDVTFKIVSCRVVEVISDSITEIRTTEHWDYSAKFRCRSGIDIRSINYPKETYFINTKEHRIHIWNVVKEDIEDDWVCPSP